MQYTLLLKNVVATVNNEVGNVIIDELIINDFTAMTNGEYKGKTAIFTSGEILAIGDLVFLNPADSRIWKARGNSLASMDCIGIVCTAAGGAGIQTTILLDGVIRLNTWAWTINAPIFVSRATAGLATETAPTTSGDIVQFVGKAIHANILRIEPNRMLITVP